MKRIKMIQKRNFYLDNRSQHGTQTQAYTKTYITQTFTHDEYKSIYPICCLLSMMLFLAEHVLPRMPLWQSTKLRLRPRDMMAMMMIGMMQHIIYSTTASNKVNSLRSNSCILSSTYCYQPHGYRISCRMSKHNCLILEWKFSAERSDVVDSKEYGCHDNHQYPVRYIGSNDAPSDWALPIHL